MLVVDPRRGTLADDTIASLPKRLRRGDLIVVNDAATLPASLVGRAGDTWIEIRLAGVRPEGRLDAVLFGAGDWHTPTEARPEPPVLQPGAHIDLGPVSAKVVAVSPRSARVVTLETDPRGDAFWTRLYQAGRPVQYSYLAAELALWDVQTGFAGRPWAVELPSAGRPLSFALLAALRAAGIGLAAVTHGAGLSSIGSADLDALLPLPERYEVSTETLNSIAETRARGGRVVAVGTSVVRALESAARFGGAGVTEWVLHRGVPLLTVDGLLTGIHTPPASHWALLGAFADADLLDRARRYAESHGYLDHEFGDTELVLAA